jgi:hypothetical protein
MAKLHPIEEADNVVELISARLVYPPVPIPAFLFGANGNLQNGQQSEGNK